MHKEIFYEEIKLSYVPIRNSWKHSPKAIFAIRKIYNIAHIHLHLHTFTYAQ